MVNDRKRFSQYVFAALLPVVCILSAGCVRTSFEGDSKFPGGARGCWEHCRAQGMEMGSFVYAGEYSTACVCRPRPNPVAPVAPVAHADEAGAQAAAVGVILQMREDEEAARQNQQQPHMTPQVMPHVAPY